MAFPQKIPQLSMMGQKCIARKMCASLFAPRIINYKTSRSYGVQFHLGLNILPRVSTVHISQVGHGGVDRASSSDARGPGIEPRPLHLKKYHFFTPKP